MYYKVSTLIRCSFSQFGFLLNQRSQIVILKHFKVCIKVILTYFYFQVFIVISALLATAIAKDLLQSFGNSETRDGCSTTGEYNVLLRDGRVQTVTYTVDCNSGYNADVSYSNEAAKPYDLEKPS